MRILAFALALLCALPATAQTTRVLETSNGAPVFVFQDRQKLREAMRLIEAGVHRTQPHLVMALVNCVVDSGTQVIVNDGGTFTSEVMVVAGRHTGCRGAVTSDRVVRR